MKAQSIRRWLWLADALLVASLVGAGAWYVVKVRPASASVNQESAWVEAAWQKYHREEIGRIERYPVKSEQELDSITREDLRDRKTRDATTIVGVFVGPPPPEPKSPEMAKEVEGPKDLEATGRPLMVMYLSPPASTSVLWEFKEGKAGTRKAFAVGEFIKSTKDEKGRFRMTGLVPNPESPKYKILFDVYDDPTKDPVRKGQEFAFDLSPKPGKDVIHPTVAPGTAVAPDPKAPPGASPPVAPSALVAGGTPPPVSAIKPDIRQNGNNLHLEFDRASYDAIVGNNADALMESVKTTVVKDDKGNPKGLQLSFGGDSVAAKFNVQPGDVLLSINGQVVHSRADAVNIVKGLSRDTKSVNVVIERNGRQIVYDIDPRDPAVRGEANKIKYGK